MKYFYIIILSFLSIFLTSSCDQVLRKLDSNYADDQDLQKALSFFIDENQYMTERDALSEEINYYRAPKILRQEFIGTLSGKTLIHIANEIKKEDDNKARGSYIAFFRIVDDIKEYGLNHPHEQVAKVYVFGGDFVNYNRGITEKFKIVVYIPDIDRLIEVDGKFIDTIYGNIDLNSDNYKWIWGLPNWADKPL